MTSLVKKHIKTLLKGKIANCGKKGMNKTMFCKEGVAQEKKYLKSRLLNVFLIYSWFQAYFDFKQINTCR